VDELGLSAAMVAGNPIAVEAGNVFSDMAFEMSRGAYRWSVHVDGDNISGPLHPQVFGPYSYNVVRSDLHYLHPLLPEMPWGNKGECGFHYYVETMEKILRHECSLIEGGRLPISWSRCGMRLILPPPDATERNRQLLIFERLLAAVLWPSRNRARLWRPFQWLSAAPMFLPIGDHWCCFGDEWLPQDALVGARSVSVRLTESVLCPDGTHKLGFDGAIYKATLRTDRTLQRDETPDDLANELSQCQLLS